MRKALLISLVLLLVAVPTVAFAQSDDTAHVRVAHFSVDAGAVDVYVNGQVAISELAFPDITDWVEMPAGTYSIAVAPAGTSLDDAVLGPMDYTLNDGDWVTFAAIGEAIRDTLDVQVLVEDFSPLVDGETRVSIFNAIPDGDPVNFVANDVVLVQTLGYPGFLGPDSDGFAEVDIVAGDYAFTATDYQDESVEVADFGSYTLGAGRHYFFAVVGLAADPLFVSATTDPADMMMDEGDSEPVDMDLGDGDLHLRVAHFSPDAGEVDVYVNGVLTLEAATISDITDWEVIPAGVYTVAVTPAGASVDEALLEVDVPLATGTWVTAAVIGEVGRDTGTVYAIVEDFSPIGAGETRVSIFNGIPDGQPVNLVVDGAALVQTLGYPGFTAESDGYASVDIVAGERTLSVVDFEDATAEIADVGTYTLGANRSYFVAVFGLEEAPLFIMVTTDIDEMMGN